MSLRYSYLRILYLYPTKDVVSVLFYQMAEGNELKRLRDELLGKEIECRNLKEDLNDLRRKYLQVVFEKKVNFLPKSVV